MKSVPLLADLLCVSRGLSAGWVLIGVICKNYPKFSHPKEPNESSRRHPKRQRTDRRCPKGDRDVLHTDKIMSGSWHEEKRAKSGKVINFRLSFSSVMDVARLHWRPMHVISGRYQSRCVNSREARKGCSTTRTRMHTSELAKRFDRVCGDKSRGR